MKWSAAIAGYFVVAAVFFIVGRLTAERRSEPVAGPRGVDGRAGPTKAESPVEKNRDRVQPDGPSPGPVQVESLEVKPVARPGAKASGARGDDPAVPPGTRPASDPSPALGPTDARVIVLEVSDFQCPVCKRAYEPLKQLASDFPGQVRVVFKQNPLKMHRNALNAAAASMAAARQGRFWEYADRLFQNQSALSEDDLARYASEVGLDTTRFLEDYRDPAVRARALAEGEAAMALGARGTPSFFVNGRMQVGWASYESIRQMVRQELDAVNALVAAGKSVKEARAARVKATLEGAEGFLTSVLGAEFAEP